VVGVGDRCHRATLRFLVLGGVGVVGGGKFWDDHGGPRGLGPPYALILSMGVGFRFFGPRWVGVFIAVSIVL